MSTATMTLKMRDQIAIAQLINLHDTELRAEYAKFQTETDDYETPFWDFAWQTILVWEGIVA
jgi:hypothetical protein